MNILITYKDGFTQEFHNVTSYDVLDNTFRFFLKDATVIFVVQRNTQSVIITKEGTDIQNGSNKKES